MQKEFLKFENLGKQYGYQWAIRKASGSIETGKYISLFGANGAGKTTLLYLLSGVYHPNEGKIIYGESNTQGNVKVKSTAGSSVNAKHGFHNNMQLMSHESMLYHRLNGIQNLEFFLSLYRDIDKDEIEKALKYTGLYAHRKKTIDSYSRGMLQRLMIARLLLARPEVVFFDEPFTGLDIRGQKLLLTILEERGSSDFDWKIESYVFVDHDINRAYTHCDEVWFIDNGRLKEVESKSKLPLIKIQEWLS